MGLRRPDSDISKAELQGRARRMNPHELADFGIQIGAVPLNGRQAVLDDFAADPLGTINRIDCATRRGRENLREMPRGRRTATRWGPQPCKYLRGVALVPNGDGRVIAHPDDGRGIAGYPSPIPGVCEQLSELVGFKVTPKRLRAWIDGCTLPPAEVKLGLARVLGKLPRQCWSHAVMEATYSGPRGRQ